MRSIAVTTLVVLVATSASLAQGQPEKNPFEGNPDAILAGMGGFRLRCADCHGTDGKAKTSKGKFSHARDLSDPQWQTEVSDARIFNSIMNGRNERGNMPPFANKLNEKEVDSLVEFVRRLKG